MEASRFYFMHVELEVKAGRMNTSSVSGNSLELFLPSFRSSSNQIVNDKFALNFTLFYYASSALCVLVLIYH